MKLSMDDSKPHIWRTPDHAWWFARSAKIVGAMGLKPKEAYESWVRARDIYYRERYGVDYSTWRKQKECREKALTLGLSQQGKT